MNFKRICTFLATLLVLLSLSGISMNADASELPEYTQHTISVFDEPNDPASYPLTAPPLPRFEIVSMRACSAPASHYLDPLLAVPDRPPCA